MRYSIYLVIALNVKHCNCTYAVLALKNFFIYAPIAVILRYNGVSWCGHSNAGVYGKNQLTRESLNFSSHDFAKTNDQNSISRQQTHI